LEFGHRRFDLLTGFARECGTSRFGFGATVTLEHAQLLAQLLTMLAEAVRLANQLRLQIGIELFLLPQTLLQLVNLLLPALLWFRSECAQLGVIRFAQLLQTGDARALLLDQLSRLESLLQLEL